MSRLNTKTLLTTYHTFLQQTEFINNNLEIVRLLNPKLARAIHQIQNNKALNSIVRQIQKQKVIKRTSLLKLYYGLIVIVNTHRHILSSEFPKRQFIITIT